MCMCVCCFMYVCVYGTSARNYVCVHCVIDVGMRAYVILCCAIVTYFDGVVILGVFSCSVML